MGKSLHEELEGPLVHLPKNFPAAPPNTYLTKDHREQLVYAQRNFLPAALDFVSSIAAPPTAVNGDIYVLNNASGVLDVDTITFIDVNEVEYTFNGNPDLSAISAGDTVFFRNSGNFLNDGTFTIKSVDDGLNKMSIDNAQRSDGSADEVSDSTSTATITHSGWSRLPELSWVQFDGQSWTGITPEILTEGVIVYIKAAAIDTFYKWDSSQWIDFDTFKNLYPVKITIDFDNPSLYVAALTADTVIYTLPPGYRMWGSVIPELSTVFSGIGLTQYDISVGVTADPDRYGKLFDAQVAGTTRELDRKQIEDWNGATDIKLFATSNQNLNLTLAGSVDIYLFVTRVKI